MVRSLMTNCVEEIFYKLNAWLNPDFATYGNKRNNWSNKYSPIMYDYIFYKSWNDGVTVWTNWFELPFFKTKLFAGMEEEEEEEEETEGKEGKKREKREAKAKDVSLSDHEPVTSTIHVWKRN